MVEDNQKPAIAISPWQVVEKALSLDKAKARVAVVVLTCLAVVAIASVWYRDGFDTKFAARVAFFGAAAYVGLAVLANLRGLLVRVLAWFLAMNFMLLTSAAVTQVVSGGRALPNVTVWCLYNWFDQGCVLASEREELVLASTPKATLDQLLGPSSNDAWISINFFEPWGRPEAEALKAELIAIGWDVQTDQFAPNSAAEGVLEIRYSDPRYQQDAINLSETLQKLIEDATSLSVAVYDLSETRWRDTEFPMHIQIWMGKK